MANEKITAIVEEIKALTLLELNELVKACEEEFGVSRCRSCCRRCCSRSCC